MSKACSRRCVSHHLFEQKSNSFLRHYFASICAPLLTHDAFSPRATHLSLRAPSGPACPPPYSYWPLPRHLPRGCAPQIIMFTQRTICGDMHAYRRLYYREKPHNQNAPILPLMMSRTRRLTSPQTSWRRPLNTYTCVCTQIECLARIQTCQLMPKYPCTIAQCVRLPK